MGDAAWPIFTLFCVLLTIKLTEAANLTWWIVFSPLALPVFAFIGLAIVAGVIVTIGSIYKNDKNKGN